MTQDATCTTNHNHTQVVEYMPLPSWTNTKEGAIELITKAENQMPRPEQVHLVSAISSEIDGANEENALCFMEAPCGVGKSAILLAIAMCLFLCHGTRVLVIEPVKKLMHQIYQEVTKYAAVIQDEYEREVTCGVLYGKKNYKCPEALRRRLEIFLTDLKDHMGGWCGSKSHVQSHNNFDSLYAEDVRRLRNHLSDIDSEHIVLLHSQLFTRIITSIEASPGNAKWINQIAAEERGTQLFAEHLCAIMTNYVEDLSNAKCDHLLNVATAMRRDASLSRVLILHFNRLLFAAASQDVVSDKSLRHRTYHLLETERLDPSSSCGCTAAAASHTGDDKKSSGCSCTFYASIRDQNISCDVLVVNLDLLYTWMEHPSCGSTILKPHIHKRNVVLDECHEYLVKMEDKLKKTVHVIDEKRVTIRDSTHSSMPEKTRRYAPMWSLNLLPKFREFVKTDVVGRLREHGSVCSFNHGQIESRKRKRDATSPLLHTEFNDMLRTGTNTHMRGDYKDKICAIKAYLGECDISNDGWMKTLVGALFSQNCTDADVIVGDFARNQLNSLTRKDIVVRRIQDLKPIYQAWGRVNDAGVRNDSDFGVLVRGFQYISENYNPWETVDACEQQALLHMREASNLILLDESEADDEAEDEDDEVCVKEPRSLFLQCRMRIAKNVAPMLMRTMQEVMEGLFTEQHESRNTYTLNTFYDDLHWLVLSKENQPRLHNQVDRWKKCICLRFLAYLRRRGESEVCFVRKGLCLSETPPEESDGFFELTATDANENTIKGDTNMFMSYVPHYNHIIKYAARFLHLLKANHIMMMSATAREEQHGPREWGVWDDVDKMLQRKFQEHRNHYKVAISNSSFLPHQHHVFVENVHAYYGMKYPKYVSHVEQVVKCVVENNRYGTVVVAFKNELLDKVESFVVRMQHSEWADRNVFVTRSLSEHTQAIDDGSQSIFLARKGACTGINLPKRYLTALVFANSFYAPRTDDKLHMTAFDAMKHEANGMNDDRGRIMETWERYVRTNTMRQSVGRAIRSVHDRCVTIFCTKNSNSFVSEWCEDTCQVRYVVDQCAIRTSLNSFNSLLD